MAFEAGRVIAGALVGVLERREALARSLALPFALYVTLQLASPNQLNALATWLYVLLALGLNVIIAITTHRVMLMGADSVPPLGIRLWGWRELRFVGHLFAVMICLLPALVAGFIPYVGPLIAVCLGVWIMSRLSLIFPAIAVDEETRLSDAWDMSNEHQLPLIATVGLFPIGLAILGSLVVIPVNLLTDGGWIGMILSSLTETLTNVFAIAALSLAYNEVRRSWPETQNV